MYRATKKRNGPLGARFPVGLPDKYANLRLLGLALRYHHRIISFPLVKLLSIVLILNVLSRTRPQKRTVQGGASNFDSKHGKAVQSAIVPACVTLHTITGFVCMNK